MYFKIIATLLSLVLVGFGQPAWFWWTGLIASIGGYALFWRVLLEYPKPTERFLLGTAWFTVVQLIQLSWFASHPYFYIYALYFGFSLLLGLQFGLLSLLITRSRLSHPFSVLGISAIWTLFEWSRLFFFSGFSWNPAGIALTGSIYPLQFASFWGVYGLSFWVILVNLCAIRAWLQHFTWRSTALWVIVAIFPYAYGYSQIFVHSKAMAEQKQILSAILVQTAFPIEEAKTFADRRSTVAHVIGQWRQILTALKEQSGKQPNLVVLPEYVVLCGTYSCVFPYEAVTGVFKETLGEASLQTLPPLSPNFSRKIKQGDQSTYFVNNAFLAQGVANFFNASVVIGLEDVEDTSTGTRHYFSSAQHFAAHSTLPPVRYDKRILLPLGEYIPFEWCRTLAAQYGVLGSFQGGGKCKSF